eukprot:3517376-Pleurochrysis_carterae.AAC.3
MQREHKVRGYLVGWATPMPLNVPVIIAEVLRSAIVSAISCLYPPKVAPNMLSEKEGSSIGRSGRLSWRGRISERDKARGNGWYSTGRMEPSRIEVSRGDERKTVCLSTVSTRMLSSQRASQPNSVEHDSIHESLTAVGSTLSRINSRPALFGSAIHASKRAQAVDETTQVKALEQYVLASRRVESRVVAKEAVDALEDHFARLNLRLDKAPPVYGSMVDETAQRL